MHPELIELQALAAGILDPSRQRAVDEHLGSCAECARKYVEVFLGRAGGGKAGGARAATPATPVATPPVRTTPAPAFAVSADVSRPVSPSPARVETIVTLRSGSQPIVEVQALGTPAPENTVQPMHLVLDAPRPLHAPVPVRAAAAVVDAPQALDPRDFAPAPAPDPLVTAEAHARAEAQARAGSAKLDDVMATEPVVADAISRLRSAGMTHIARSLTPVLAQPAIAAAPPAPARANGGVRPRTWIAGVAAAAVLLVGGGVVAYRGMVHAAAEAAAQAATRAATAAPSVVAQQAAPAAPAAGDSAPVRAAALPQAGAPAATITSGGTVAPTPEAAASGAPARETRVARRVASPAADDPAPRRTNVSLPSVNIPDAGDAVTDDGSMDRLNARNTSRAAASDLQKSAGWAASRTAKP